MSTGQLVLPRTTRLSAGSPDRGLESLAGRVAGHLWTVVPSAMNALNVRSGPAAEPFYATVKDPQLGTVRLSGMLSEVAESDTLVLIVHGLAGNAGSIYCSAAAGAARKAGFASLRLSMRGADYSGEDIFHGGLVEDLRAALASRRLARYDRVLLIGYSVGGHIALRAAIEKIDPRLRAVAAVCPPLDLDRATVAFDAPARRLYRDFIFRGLNKSYARAASRRRAPTPAEVVRRARSCRERDALTVVPRFGFKSEGDYYARASVASDIHRLDIPSLLVATLSDPIIPAETLRPALADASAALTVRWVERGGHVFFPSAVSLGQEGPKGLEPQVMSWLKKQVQG